MHSEGSHRFFFLGQLSQIFETHPLRGFCEIWEHKRWNSGQKRRFSGWFWGVWGRFGNQTPHPPIFGKVFSKITGFIFGGLPLSYVWYKSSICRLFLKNVVFAEQDARYLTWGFSITKSQKILHTDSSVRLRNISSQSVWDSNSLFIASKHPDPATIARVWPGGDRQAASLYCDLHKPTRRCVTF